MRLYFDQDASPGGGDWTLVHEAALKRARAFLLVCSPGAYSKFGPDDWVHKELEWWIENRKTTAPIVIDPVGEGGDRYVPELVKEQWPNAQRISVEPGRWADLPDDERTRTEESPSARQVISTAQGCNVGRITSYCRRSSTCTWSSARWIPLFRRMSGPPNKR